MYELYSDMHHVTDALEQIGEQVRAGHMPAEGRLVVADFGQAKACALGTEEVKRRNIFPDVDDHVCRIEWNYSEHFAGRFELTLTFHDSEMDSAFKLDPRSPHPIGEDHATCPLWMCDRLDVALTDLFREHDADATFSEVSAASIGSYGRYADFEFEYTLDGIDI